MKFVKFFLMSIAAIVMITACQKELDFETDGLAHGSLKYDVTGDCLPATINGIFKADSVLDDNNFVDIQVNLTITGNYDIRSDTVNGYSFRGDGVLGNSGINTVRLYASGKPASSGVDVFTIRFDTSVCYVNVTVIGTGTGVAVFTLGGSPGACASNVNGIYTQGTALDVNNTVALTVNVTATGTYNIIAASVNGMLFSGAGLFSSIGIQVVTLNGAGVPLNAGTHQVIVTNIISTCNFDINVVPTGGGGAAVYSLNVTGATCSGASYSGTFTAGTALTSAEAVLINATVTSIGTYTVTTNTVNGMTFSGTGTFTSTTGPQPIVLTGTGTPLASGIFNFTATAGSSTCTFSVTVNGAIPPPNSEYLLFTTNSNFSQRQVGGAPTDTLYTKVGPNTINIIGLNYSIYQGMENGVVVDSSYFRKNTGKYYNLVNTQVLGFANSSQVDFMLLDSTLSIGGSWIADLGTNTLGPLPVTIKANCSILDKGATVVVAGVSYTNVIKVHYLYSYNTGAADTNFRENEMWFAKGLGFIYIKVNDVPMTTSAELETTRIQVF